jgi:hypothetical protein
MCFFSATQLYGLPENAGYPPLALKQFSACTDLYLE